MKKFIFMMLVSVMGIVSANAQTAIQESKILDNTYVGLQVGANTPLSFNSVFPLNTTVGVRLGKDITPVFGLNVEGTAWFGSATDKQFRFDNVVGHNAFRAINTGINGTVNLTNLFLGYNGVSRNFEVSTVTGLGWVHVFNPSVHAKNYNALTAKTAVDLAWNITNDKAHTVYVEPAVLWNLNGHGFDGVAFNKNRAWLQIAVGYTYHFKTSNGTHHFVKHDVGALNNEINNLRSELAKKPTEVEKVVERTVTNTVNNSKWVVTFANDDATVTDDAAVVLGEIPSNASVNVVGHASTNGTEEYNQTLSERRAQNVADVLSANGVNVKSVSGVGKTGEPAARVVVVTAE